MKLMNKKHPTANKKDDLNFFISNKNRLSIKIKHTSEIVTIIESINRDMTKKINP
jgi:hypothetical protein